MVWSLVGLRLVGTLPHVAVALAVWVLIRVYVLKGRPLCGYTDEVYPRPVEFAVGETLQGARPLLSSDKGSCYTHVRTCVNRALLPVHPLVDC